MKGKDNIDCALTLNNIGTIYNNIGNFNEALLKFKNCLEIQSVVKGKDNIDCVLTLNNIGNACIYLGKYHEALENF